MDNKHPDNTGKKQGRIPPIEYRFKPGQSGNPKGKAPGTLSIVSMLKEELLKFPEGSNQQDKKTYLELLIRKILKKALVDEDTKMITDIIDRVDGKPEYHIVSQNTNQNYNTTLKETLIKYDKLSPDARKGIINRFKKLAGE